MKKTNKKKSMSTQTADFNENLYFKIPWYLNFAYIFACNFQVVSTFCVAVVSGSLWNTPLCTHKRHSERKADYTKSRFDPIDSLWRVLGDAPKSATDDPLRSTDLNFCALPLSDSD